MPPLALVIIVVPPKMLHKTYHIMTNNIATLALGSWPKQGLARLHAKKEAREWRKMWRNEPSHSQGSFHFGSLESRWTSESSKSDCKGQNPMDWRFIYIIGKILKCKCLKWACMTNLETENISYSQKKSRESNW